MNFPPDKSTLKSGRIYSQNLPLKISVNAENTFDAAAARDLEREDELINGASPDTLEEMIKTNLEPLNEQIFTLTQLLNKLIQESSVRYSPTAGSPTQQTQSRHLPSNEAGTYRSVLASANGSTGYPLDNEIGLKVMVFTN